MKKDLPRKKLSTDEVVKNLFDPIQKNPDTATEPPKPAPDDIFFETATKPRRERRVRPEPLPPLTEEEKELRSKFEKAEFNPLPWAIAISVLFLTSFFFVNTVEMNDRIAQSSALLEAHEKQIAKYENALGVQMATAEHLENLASQRRDERRRLLRKDIFMRKNIRRGRSQSATMAAITGTSMPETVRLEKIAINGSDLQMEGITSSSNDAARWLEQLKKSGLVRSSILSRKETQVTKNPTLTEFTIHADLVS